MNTLKPIRLAIAGVGNCANALVQGIHYYGDDGNKTEEKTFGLMTPKIGGWGCGDLNVVAAFDVDRRKVGIPLGEAIFAPPNCARRFVFGSLPQETVVMMGPILDGVAPHMANYSESQSFRVSDHPAVDVASILRDREVDVLVSYMPVGADLATQYYASACIEAGCAFVNCTPSFIASEPEWAERFRHAGLPIVGDDIKSQVGATIVHRDMVRLFAERGIHLLNTYQLNVGGNSDFLNMLARDRLTSKKISKTNAVSSQIIPPIGEDKIAIGPSDYVPWKGDQKVAFIRLEGKGFGGAPMEIEIRLAVQDSANSAGVAMDGIRHAALAKRLGLAGPIEEVCAWLMKSPPRQLTDTLAKEQAAAFATRSV